MTGCSLLSTGKFDDVHPALLSARLAPEIAEHSVHPTVVRRAGNEVVVRTVDAENQAHDESFHLIVAF